jgi:hypothetical protein
VRSVHVLMSNKTIDKVASQLVPVLPRFDNPLREV